MIPTNQLRSVLLIVRAGNDISKADFTHTKRTTCPTKMKIGIYLEIGVFSGQENQYVWKCKFVWNKLAKTLSYQICMFMWRTREHYSHKL